MCIRDRRIILEPNRPILKTLYDRYMKAEEIISSNEDISKIMISGGGKMCIRDSGELIWQK